LSSPLTPTPSPLPHLYVHQDALRKAFTTKQAEEAAGDDKTGAIACKTEAEEARKKGAKKESGLKKRSHSTRTAGEGGDRKGAAEEK